MNELELKLLKLMAERTLLTTPELKNLLGEENGLDLALASLRQQGYIEKIESLGICWIVTKRGLQAIKNLSL
ncbi:MAG: hypothetical protein DRP12_02115 [Candidatus Aenigmatarchaeota archaeon]|nr:MAG: hypothetical protein DRP12_02115 [Candidatus Aenigmarchaeota archaeon]